MARRIILLLAFVFAAALIVRAQTTGFTYQGKLSDTTMPSGNGTYSMQFRLYDVDAGGSPVAPPQNALVTVENRIFTATLDFGAAPFQSGAQMYLEIEIAGTTLSPRQRIGSVPFANRAHGLSSFCSPCVTSAQIVSLDGAKVSGAVASATNAQQLGGVAASSYLQTNGNGSQLTNLNGNNITSGTISETRLGVAGMGFSGRINNASAGPAVQFGGANGFTSATGSSTNIEILSPNRNCTAQNLSVRLIAPGVGGPAPPAPGVVAVVLHSNGVDTAVQCSILSGSACSSGASSSVIAASSTLGVKIYTSGDVSSSFDVLFGWECR